MQFTLIRHGQPEWQRDGRNVDNPRLTETGRQQAEMTARSIAGESFDYLLVSPLLRAQQTAAPIAAALDLEPDTLPWLAEIAMPKWDGTTVDVMEVFMAARLRPPEEHWTPIGDGEGFADFSSRVGGGLRSYLYSHGVSRLHEDYPIYSDVSPDMKVLIVAHAGTNSVLVTSLLGIPSMPWEWERFQMNHSSITRLVPIGLSGGHGFGLRSASDTAHLPMGLRTR
jgi:2,3-bisphosphoglycerate-dependent phosphoglycerate mutase